MAKHAQGMAACGSSIMKEHEVYHLGKTEVAFNKQRSVAPEDNQQYSSVCACMLRLLGRFVPPAVATADDAAYPRLANACKC